MPHVPRSDNVVSFPRQQLPSPTDFAMAAAMMHEEGRLVEPQPEPELAPDADEGEV